MKKLALVTCLYDLVKRGSTEHRTIDWVLQNADWVLGQDRELVIFTDPELEAELRKRRGNRRTKIVPVPFEKLLTKERFAAAERGMLQENARKTKVTPTYVQLMWAKYAMLGMALEITQTSHLGWIDLGITHIAKLPPTDIDVFADPSDAPRVHVLRCFGKRDVDHPNYWRNVQGHLAGGLVVGGRSQMRDLAATFWTAVDRAISMGLAPLDEGVLSYVVGQRVQAFSYSFGDYEDILRNHDAPRGGEAHRAWIAADAKARGLPEAMVEQGSAAMVSDRPLLGLVMIVKNESKRISEVLASYRDHIDAWTILDTGSTDGTQDMIRGELAGIPGTLYEEPFVDFATSRNRALDLHGNQTVFTIMPNGDVLFGGAELRSFLEAHRNDYAKAYRVRIAPGHYYHPLVMRAGGGWRYRWRTHECAMGSDQGPQIPGVTVHRDRGQRTDAEWRARWERDLVLLNQDREADPNDPRPYFYLGQTHECLGQHAEALPFFERRAEMGGYFDEVYEAKFRIAKMMQAIKRPWAEVQQKFLEAHAHDPRRAEPLYAIAEHWYDLEQHAISRIFSVAAAELPKPPTDLFLDEEIYTWRAKDKAAISCFYSGHKEEGRRFAEDAVWKRPHDERLRANWSFFAASAAETFKARVQAIDFQPQAGWHASNPSIYRHGDQLRCIVRTVNYRIVNGSYVTPSDDVVSEDGPYKGWQVIRTRNFLVDLDENLKMTRTVELVDKTGEARTTYPVHGFEDARLFAWRGKWWATATVCDFTEDGRREIALLEIDEDGSVVRAEALRGPWSGAAQKNWMPLVDQDVVKFVYAASSTDEAGPATIFDLAETDIGAVRRLSWFVAGKYAVGCAENVSFSHGRLRGGSQAVRVDDGWIFVVHDVALPGGGRTYLHRFGLLNDKLELVAMTDPFYFERLGIEFCAGLARCGSQLVASYAVNDGSARFGIFDLVAVRDGLREDFVI